MTYLYQSYSLSSIGIKIDLKINVHARKVFCSAATIYIIWTENVMIGGTKIFLQLVVGKSSVSFREKKIIVELESGAIFILHHLARSSSFVKKR